jgi:dTDP-4-dehydrorhamnose reductase
MKILVLGDGLLGNEIIKQTNWDYLSRKKDGIDVNNLNDWQHKLSPYDVILNCIAHTDTYSINKKIHWEVNFEFVSYLAGLCNELGKKLVHISTDYIYAHSTPFATENDVPVHLPTWYGYTKLLGDAHVQLVSDDYLICRLSHKPNPFPYLKAWSNMRTNCDYVDVIAGLVIKLVNNNAFGVYNVGTEVKSIYELAKKTNNVEPINRPTQVPEDTSMSINKLKEIL